MEGEGGEKVGGGVLHDEGEWEGEETEEEEGEEGEEAEAEKTKV